ncbi:MAG: hypothetical protein H7067_07620 [Burkholderiales bacterium]|nr:hypothetical protein [Opitutaceae bacterium]
MILIPDPATSLRVGCAVRLVPLGDGRPAWACTLWWSGCVSARSLARADRPDFDALVADLRAQPEAWTILRQPADAP